MNPCKRVVTQADFDREQKELFRKLLYSPSSGDWLLRRSELIRVLSAFGVEDIAQTGENGDFWISEECERADYLPVVGNTWAVFQASALLAVHEFVLQANGRYLVTIVRPFPAEAWGLTVLISSEGFLSTSSGKSLQDVEMELKEHSLEFLLP